MTEAIEGYRQAISIPNTEAEYGVLSPAYKAALDSPNGDRWRPNEPAFIQVTDGYIDDAGRIGDFIGATSSQHETSDGTGNFTADLATEILAWALSIIYGNVATSSASSAGNEAQVINRTGVTAGEYALEWPPTGEITAPLAFDADAAAHTAALLALDAFASGDVTPVVSGDNVTLTFGAAYAAMDVAQFIVHETTTWEDGEITISTSAQGQAAGVRTHTFKEPDVCTLNPPSYALAEGLVCGGPNDSWYVYPGVNVNTLTLTIDARGYGKLALELLQCGVETVLEGSFVFPAAESGRTDVLGKHVSIWLGASKTAPYKILRDELASLTIKIDAGLSTPTRINDDDHVTERQYGKGKPDAEITLSLKGSKASRFYALKRAQKTGTRPGFWIELNPHTTPQRIITVQCSKTKFEMTNEVNEREPRHSLTIRPEANTTDDGKILWTCQTNETAYNVAI